MKPLYTEEEIETISAWMKTSPVDPDLDLADSNFVAELCVSTVRGELPVWMVRFDDGTTLKAREYQLEIVKRRHTLLEPKFLFSINWADSGPDFSWNEDYYVTFLPELDIHVVTASQDSPDMYGHCDLAIACFPQTSPESVGPRALKIIGDWWAYLHENWSQPEWASFLEAGMVDRNSAIAWSDKTWREKDEDEDEDEDEN